jgi:hypothetical protein
VSERAVEADERVERLARRGLAALDDDLDTPGAIAALRELLALPPSASRRAALQQLGDGLGLSFDA